MADEMTATGNKTADFAKPSEGAVQCACVDIINLGFHPNVYMGEDKGMVHKCAIVWQLDENNPDTPGGAGRFIAHKEFTFSMNEKANLRKFLGLWRGKSYTDQEAELGVPLHKLVGVNGVMQIEHKQSKTNPDRTYVNIISITPLMKGTEKMQAVGYTRPKYLADKIAGAKSEHENGNGFEDSDDSLPF